ncbi:hypothetical protein GCM10009665_51640 [Kitasatospora nipponensis]|uniref:FHA domain-containing protein n=1 Tax=Kitasatospora nipponensis TaxID=258049 RepID=A0ABN1WNB0_9ACTN
MPICPSGHESQAADWCDFCGCPMSLSGGAGAYGAVPPAPPMPPQAPPAMPGATEGLVLCRICQTPQTGRYCEECGYDYELASASTPIQRPQPPAGGYGYPQPGADHGYGQNGALVTAPPTPPAPDPHALQPGGYGYPPPAAPGYPQPPHADPAGGYGYPQPGHHGGAVHHGGAPGAPAAGQGWAENTSFHLPPPVEQVHHEPVRTTWIAVVTADREYYTAMMARSGPEAAGLYFPAHCPDRRIPLTGRGQLRIGRRSKQRGTVPEIDLGVSPEDPGASHDHALLAEQADGSWVLVALASMNGTTMNGSAEMLPENTAIPLHDGDRIHIGAWTTIELHRG